MAWNGPPPHHTQMPFWDFMQQIDPNQPGAGVDHAAAAQTYPFGEGGYGPWAGRGRWSWGGPGGGRQQWGRHWGRHGGRRGGHRGTDTEEEGPTDVEQEMAGEDAPLMREHEGEKEKQDSPETMRDVGDDHPDPPESVPQPAPDHRHGHGYGPGMRGRGRCGGRGGGGRGGMHAHHVHHAHHSHGHGHPGPHHGPHGPHGHRGPSSPFAGPWNFGPMMQAFSQHPVAQGLRDYFGRTRNDNSNNNHQGGDGDVESFSPPVDIFQTAGGWVLHIAVPGARKDDVGVNWDADRSTLSVSGVVHRPGDEVFLQGMVRAERRVGLFQRDVPLPPNVAAGGAAGAVATRADREEVDAEGITAKMEDGVLVVNVPMLEREWTEVRKVDIE